MCFPAERRKEIFRPETSRFRVSDANSKKQTKQRNCHFITSKTSAGVGVVVGIVCGGERQRVAIVYSLAAGATATAATTTISTTVSFITSSSIRCCFGFRSSYTKKRKNTNYSGRTNARAARETTKNQKQSNEEDNNMAAAAKSLSRGAFILFEGVDRCGKTTQASKLVESLNQSGVASELWRYPDRTTTIGKMIDDYLQCKADSDDASMHLLFAANRWEKKKMMEEKLRAGVTLVVDRYGYSGVAFTTAKKLPGLDQQWCKHSETGLVKPDCLMYMEISEDAAKKRGGFGEERYETTEMQKNVREVFADLREDWWNVVDADRTIEEVQRDVQTIARDAVERCKRGKELEHFEPGW